MLVLLLLLGFGVVKTKDMNRGDGNVLFGDSEMV